MKGRNITYIVMMAVLLGTFSVVAFLLPFHRTASFWAAYAFGAGAILVTGVTGCIAGRDSDPSHGFYGLPVIITGGTYLSIQLALSIIVMALPYFLQGMTAVVFFVVLLAIYLIIMAASFAGKVSAEGTDRYIRDKAEQFRKRENPGKQDT